MRGAGCRPRLLVVDGQPHEHPSQGVLVDLRVDHHDAPLDELARLLDARGAFDAGLRSYAELMDGQPDAAVASAAAALARLPDDENFRFAHGIATVLAGDIGAGRSELARTRCRPAVLGHDHPQLRGPGAPDVARRRHRRFAP